MGGRAYDPANPEALKALPESRALIDAGDYAKATEIADARFMATPKRQMAYQTIGDLKLTFPVSTASRRTMSATWTWTAPSPRRASRSAEPAIPARSSAVIPTGSSPCG